LILEDLGDIGSDLIQFKDYSGRAFLLEFQSYVSNTDGSGNPIFDITVKGVGKYKLYLSRQRNIRVDPFGDKEN
jgi:hypothetical protein